MRIKKYLIIFSIMLATILLLTVTSYAGDLELEVLHFDIQLNTDGSMNVTENWNIEVEDTNTLYKTFEIDGKYSDITNVEVKEITKTGQIQNFKQINQEMYHVTKDCYYALENKNGEFEIAWGVSVHGYEKKQYKISYKVNDVLEKYTDYTELYWKFVGNDFEIPANLITGTIKLPMPVDNMDNLRVWAHGQLNGNIERKDEQTIKFDITNFKPGKYIEVRVAVLENAMFSGIETINNEKNITTILVEEQKWADVANKERAVNRTMMVHIPIILSIIFSLFAIHRIIKLKEVLKQNPKLEPETKVDYYREIPDENQTPAEIAFIHYFGGTDTSHMPKVISATMLDLCLKGLISFETEKEDKNDNIKVFLQNSSKKEGLKESEKLVYELLEKVQESKKKYEDCFTMKEFEKYAQRHNTDFLRILKQIEKAAKDETAKVQIYDKSIIQKRDKYIGLGIIFIVLSIMILIYSLIIGISLKIVAIPIILSITLAIIGFNISNRFNRLTQKGINEQELLKGLKRYLEDYSMIDDKTVPEIAIWEKYLVLATVFGISDKVIKQLKIKYPEMLTEEYVSTHNATFLYMMIVNRNFNFVHSLDNSVQHIYTSGATYNMSSGSGYGGGFSSGGGFGGGGGGRWWQIIHQKIKKENKS